jgi:serine/threonine-protein kinase HipA
MIRVWSDTKQAGVLDRVGPKGSTFAYSPEVATARAASITMPVRVQSYDLKVGLLPIFEMNLPEGALRERLIRRFAKATGTFDDFDMLQIVGRTQIGRIRYSAMDKDLSEAVPFQSIDEILRARRDSELFDFLLNEFAVHSGLSGVQPKVMIRARGEKLSMPGVRQSPSILGATHIVKLWDEDEFPELAANEYFCLQAARKLGLNVPTFALSDDGGALIVERFDLVDGHYIGFEDFCVLNALGTADKYKGGYETRLFKRMREFVSPLQAAQSLEELFRIFLLNCAIRNGDAHLKNFGVTYDRIDGDVQIAPVYDLVSTWAYLPKDPMALTINGSTNWPDRKTLITLGQIRSDLGLKKIEEHIEATADALNEVGRELQKYFSSREGEIGTRMLAAWETGIRDSLGATRGLKPVPAVVSGGLPRMAKSDGLLLEYLRQQGGAATGTLISMANALGIPQSTFGASVKRLVERGFIRKGSKSIILLPREI